MREASGVDARFGTRKVDFRNEDGQALPEGTRRTFNLGREMTFHEQMGFSTLPLKIWIGVEVSKKLACLI